MQYAHEHKPLQFKEYKGPPPVLPAYCARLGDQARDYLESRDLDPLLAGHNGWYPSDMDVPRIVIPCMNTAGICYWQARRMDDSQDLRYDSPTYPRGDSIVVVYPEERRPSPRLFIFEGPMDALAAAAFGHAGVALMGNNPDPEAIDNIVRCFGRTHAPFVIVPDNDDLAAGTQLLGNFATRGVVTKVALLTGGKDLCDLSIPSRDKFLQRALKVK